MADSASTMINTFHEALNYGMEILGLSNIALKEKQYEVLKALVVNNRDVLAVLPTGYGKSLIYQMLPLALDFVAIEMKPIERKSTVLVISPLNALMRNQFIKLREGGLNVCVLKGDRVAADDGDEEVTVDIPIEMLLSTTYDLIFAHPEVLIDNKKVSKVLKSPSFKEKVKAIVVDEAHLVIDWKEFRPAYSKLGSLASVFENIPLLGLTATATKITQTKIKESLGMIEPTVIDDNPDRKNIYFSSSRRGNRGDEKLGNILDPLVNDLCSQRTHFPLTIIYGTLETISSCYEYFSIRLGDKQYEPVGAPRLAKNRLYTQFHAQYPDHERQRIVDELVQGSSKLRVIFATVAFGIGLDIRNIRQIIHIGLPYTMEEYFQEAGRAGRDGLPVKAHVYYNSYDISKGKKQLTQVMRDYVNKSQCKRGMILNYFGFPVPPGREAVHSCCDYHKKKCDCDECIISHVSNLFEVNVHNDTDDSVPADISEAEHLRPLDPNTEAKLCEELDLFRLSLPGSGRSSVGSTSLCSGISIALIDQVVQNAPLLTSVEEIEARLAIYSRKYATAIWAIVQKYT